MLADKNKLTLKKIFIFWYPLALTWLMMALENPFLTAIIARLDDAKFNLAAFGVAFYFAIMIEAPIIMIMSAATALVKDRFSFHKLTRFTSFLNFVISLAMILTVIPPVFNFIGLKLLELPPQVAHLTQISLIFLAPWPAAIGFRRFYQGILIRFNLTRRVAYGTAVRLSSMAITALILFNYKLQGAFIGAIALTTGVIFEAIAIRIMVHTSLKTLNNTELKKPKSRLTYRTIIRFYYPLALTSMLALGIHPVVTFFMGRSRFSLESLAVLPVINAFVFIFRGVGLSFQEVGIALMGEKRSQYIQLRNFAAILGISLMTIMGLIAFTPLMRIWYQSLSGLSVELSAFSFLPTQILVLLPALTVLISFQRAILVQANYTSPITGATIIEVSIIALVLFLCISYFNLIGAVAASLAYLIGRITGNLYLIRFQFKTIRQTQ